MPRVCKPRLAARSIDNELDVRPAAPTTTDEHELYQLVQDANIVTRIELQLRWSRGTQGTDITAFSDDGKVRLSGTVANETARKAAERIALRTTGVRDVENEVRVKSPEGSGDIDNGGGDTTAVEPTDDQISARVAAALEFAYGVQDGNIQVDTENGVVSLSGNVRSKDQKKLATTIARQLSGVRDVRNRLSIQQALQPVGRWESESSSTSSRSRRLTTDLGSVLVGLRRASAASSRILMSSHWDFSSLPPRMRFSA